MDAPVGLHDDDDLWRRIPCNKIIEGKPPINYIVPNRRKNGPKCRPSTLAFSNNSKPHVKEMSVLIAKLVLASGRTAGDTCNTNQPYLVSFKVGLVRNDPFNREVRHTPNSAEYAHADVVGEKDHKLQKELTRQFKWVIEPDPSECDQ